MAESNSQVMHQIVATRTLTQLRLLPANLLSWIGSLLLAFVIVLTGTLIWLLANPSPDGLSRIATGMAGSPYASVAGRLTESIGPLQRSDSALAVLIGCICVALPLRWFVKSTADSLVKRHISSAVQRMRQHLHRKAIRLEPADLTGDQARTTDRLFRDSTKSLEAAAAGWAGCWTINFPDLVVLAILALAVNWRVATETMIPVVLCWFALRLETLRNDSSISLLLEQADRGLKRLAEGLRKSRIVTGFAMQQQEQSQFEKYLEQYQDRCRMLQKQRDRSEWTQRLILLFCIFVPGYILARHALAGGEFRFAAVVMIAICAALMFRLLLTLQNVRTLAGEALVKSDEINSYISRVPLVGQAVGARFMEPLSKSLQFNQISLSTSRHPRLLNHLDLRIGFGETVGILSLNPVSAYALASLIPRFVDPDSGQVLIDGQDIRHATLESLRAEAIFVSGSDPVFNGTVLDNITCGQADISRQQVQEACKLVHADHFIRNLPRGYETTVGEHGVSLDHGQVFRLSLARAEVRKPALMIIEEPQSILDAETKAMLDDAYQRLASERTVIFLPSRLSTVKKCDRVIMIHEGRVIADDTHERLVRTHELYRHWEYMHFNTFRDESELVPVLP